MRVNVRALVLCNGWVQNLWGHTQQMWDQRMVFTKTGRKYSQWMEAARLFLCTRAKSLCVCPPISPPPPLTHTLTPVLVSSGVFGLVWREGVEFAVLSPWETSDLQMYSLKPCCSEEGLRWCKHTLVHTYPTGVLCPVWALIYSCRESNTEGILPMCVIVCVCARSCWASLMRRTQKV